MKLPLQTETDLPPPPFGGAQGAAHRFAQDLHQARYRTSHPVQLLGEGGIGRIIIAEETLLRRPVAMKTLRDDRAGELYEARLIREARITGLLEHPSIVPVHDIGRNDDGKIYYTMKKVVGLTLRDVIEHLRPATGDSTNEAKALRESVQERFGSIPARLGLFQKVCDAIAFAHAHPLRVIHRDLKPENIMVGEFGEVLVMDWGLAKVLVTDEETFSETPAPESNDQSSLAGFTVSRIALSTAGQFVGTPMYAAPEQLEGRLEDIDEKSDVYALGGVLYHLLTLEPPISVESHDTAETKSPDIATQTAPTPGSTPDWDALVRFIRGGQVAPLLRETTGSKSIPEALRPLLQRTLAPDLSQRIASVSALQQAISQFLAGYANDFEQAGAWKHFVYFVKRHKGVALASAAALIIIASLTAGFTRRVSHEKERAQAEAERATKAETETTKQLVETNRLLERSQLEEGKAWLERGRAALSRGDNLSALMLAGRAVGYQGYGRKAEKLQPFAEAFPLLLAGPMSNLKYEKERAAEADYVTQFLDSVRPTYLPIWVSADQRPHNDDSVIFSPDGTYIASHSWNTIRLWDSATGKELNRCQGQKSLIETIAISPDGCRLASGSMDTTIKLWDASSGKELSSLEGHKKRVVCVTFSPDGKRLASGSTDQTIKIWDIATCKELVSLEGHREVVMCLAFSPDGTRLVSGSMDHTVKLWDLGTGKKYASLEEHESTVTSVVFSPDGTRLASTSGEKEKGDAAGNTVKIWDSTTGRELHTLRGHGGRVWCVAYSPDGKYLASSSVDNTIRFWNTDTGKEVGTINGHKHEVRSIAYSPDGTRLVSCSLDGTTKIWDVALGKQQSSLRGHSKRVWCVDMSPDGTCLASGSEDTTVRLWDRATGRELARISWEADIPVWGVAFSPDGLRLAIGSEDTIVTLLDCTTGRQFEPSNQEEEEAALKWLEVAAKRLKHPEQDGSSDTEEDKPPQEPTRRIFALSHNWEAEVVDNAIFVAPAPSKPDLAARFHSGLVSLPDRELQFPNIQQTTPMQHVRQDTLAQLADPTLTTERRAELRMELCAKSSQFRAATALWQRLLQDEWPGFKGATVPEDQSLLTISATSPVRRLYLLALIDATKHPQIHGHATICQTAAQIAPVLTKEMMAMPTISLAMMSLMQSLAKVESAEMKAPRNLLLKKLGKVASPEWLAALQAATTKP